MWFFNQKRRVREVVLKIAEGLQDGTLVLDPPLVPDPPLDFDAVKRSPPHGDFEPSPGESLGSSHTEEGYAQLLPLEDRILVEPLKVEDEAAGGIILLDSAKMKPQRGLVLAVGSGKLLKDGQRIPLAIAQGDKIVYGKYAGDDVKIDGNDVKILHESDILAKIVK